MSLQGEIDHFKNRKYSVLFLILFFLVLESGASLERGLIVVEPAMGFNSTGISLSYYSYTQSRGWVSPSVYALHFQRTAHPNHGRTGNLLTGALGISFLRMRSSLWTPMFSGRLIFGNEMVRKDNGSTYPNIIMGVGFSQEILRIPQNGLGLVPGVGLFQTALANSRMYPWDMGVKLVLGMVF